MSVIFDQLRISDDGKKMFVNVHVNSADYFDNFYIDSITIMTADKVSEACPELFTDEYILQKTIEGNQKELNLVLTPHDFNLSFTKHTLSDDLFFVYIKCKLVGTIPECVPCRLTELTTLGVTFDVNLLHQRVMDYTKSLSDTCIIPTGFVDFLLLWSAFKAAVETEHFIAAIKYWNLLFGVADERPSRDGSNSPYGSVSKKAFKGCGCHG